MSNIDLVWFEKNNSTSPYPPPPQASLGVATIAKHFESYIVQNNIFSRIMDSKCKIEVLTFILHIKF